MSRRARIVLLICLSAVGFAATTGQAAAQGCVDAQLTPDGANHAAVAAATLCFANVERASAGLPALRPSGQLRKAAAAHSRDMVTQRYFDHVSPTGSTLLSRVKRTGYTRGARRFHVVENLGWGSGPVGSAQAIVEAWMGSPGHRANLLARNVREAGIGVAAGSPTGGRGATYTMVLGSRR